MSRFSAPCEYDFTSLKKNGEMEYSTFNTQGTLVVDDGALEIHKKSKLVRGAFGLVGSLIEGDGKLVETVPYGSITRVVSTAKEESECRSPFTFFLSDGRRLFVELKGMSKKDNDIGVQEALRAHGLSIEVQN